MYLFLFWGWQTIRFFNLASSNQTELAGFTLVDGKIHLFFYYMFCASSVIFLPSFERHGLVVDGVQEEVMDNFLRKKNTPGHVFLNYLCTSSSSWGGTLKRESWEIWYLLHKKIMRGRETKGFHSTWSYSALQAWRASPPPRRPPREGWWRRCPCSEGPVPPGQRWPPCT